ncbi:MAG TPA: hypothetical protein VIK72_02615 [Clostridiaceae bacterium]
MGSGFYGGQAFLSVWVSVVILLPNNNPNKKSHHPHWTTVINNI